MESILVIDSIHCQVCLSNWSANFPLSGEVKVGNDKATHRAYMPSHGYVSDHHHNHHPDDTGAVAAGLAKSISAPAKRLRGGAMSIPRPAG